MYKLNLLAVNEIIKKLLILTIYYKVTSAKAKSIFSMECIKADNRLILMN